MVSELVLHTAGIHLHDAFQGYLQKRLQINAEILVNYTPYLLVEVNDRYQVFITLFHEHKMLHKLRSHDRS